MTGLEEDAGFEDLDWDRTTVRLSEQERKERYESHVARLRRDEAEQKAAAPTA